MIETTFCRFRFRAGGWGDSGYVFRCAGVTQRGLAKAESISKLPTACWKYRGDSTALTRDLALVRDVFR